jgi:hypothetical protein
MRLALERIEGNNLGKSVTNKGQRTVPDAVNRLATLGVPLKS